MSATATGADGQQRPLVDLLRETMQRELAAGGVTKRSAVRAALAWAIHSRTLEAGARLPPETALAKALGVSLGTVQAALGQVQDLGLIERRRGDGTRVTAGGGFPTSVWHFRMHVIDTGEQFRIRDQEVEVLQTSERGPWQDHLGDCPAYLMIRRRIEGTGDIAVGAEMVLDPALVPPHSLVAHELRLTNLRTLLEQRLRIRSTRAVHRVGLDRINPRKLALFGMELGAQILKVEARTFLTDGRPFYFQTLYVPADRLELEL